MTIEQQFGNAVADFEALILEGFDSHHAMDEAAISNGLRPEVLERRLSKSMPIEALVEKIRGDADYARFIAIAREEIEKCKKRTGAYSQLGLLSLGAEEAIAKSVETSIGRGLTNHEIWKIEEMWNPWLSELQLARKAHVKALRKLSIGD